MLLNLLLKPEDVKAFKTSSPSLSGPLKIRAVEDISLPSVIKLPIATRIQHQQMRKNWKRNKAPANC
nr:hypothetical protein CFP56_53956 [Quercus suber]